jgi:multidrug efflux pump subunit AcrA (membrane-fusion protein)
MNLSEYVKPALGVVFVVAVGGFYYWFENRSHAEPEDPPSQAVVVVTKATKSCLSDEVRVTGFIVPRREALISVDQEGSKVTDLFVREGDMVLDNQELARLTAPPQQQQQQQPGGGKSGPVSLRTPGPGLVTEVRTAVGAPASPQAGPMFRISINNEVELEAEVPSIHLLKLKPNMTVRISRDDAPDLLGKVRQIAPQINRDTQLGKIRISVNNNSSLKIGMFARANIDATRVTDGQRSCNVAVPRTAIDRLTLQVVRGDAIETRKVRVGLTVDNSTEILEGLAEGEIVVSDAGTSLHDGDRIKTTFADELDRTRAR